MFTLYCGVLQQRQDQEGKFLLCRTLTPAVYSLWCDVVVEDPSGENAAFLRLTNFTKPKFSKNVGNGGGKSNFLWMVPPGSFIAVKNPAVGQILLEATCLLEVMSDNPGDVLILTGKKVKELFPGEVLKKLWLLKVDFSFFLI